MSHIHKNMFYGEGRDTRRIFEFSAADQPLEDQRHHGERRQEVHVGEAGKQGRLDPSKQRQSDDYDPEEKNRFIPGMGKQEQVRPEKGEAFGGRFFQEPGQHDERPTEEDRGKKIEPPEVPVSATTGRAAPEEPRRSIPDRNRETRPR